MENMELLVTLGVLGVAVVLLVGNFLRNDIVAILVVLALMLSGVLQPSEALSGFSSSAVIIIACMFIVGKAITYTGIAQRLGESIIKYGGTDERKLLVLVMVGAASVGSFMSSTATAAIFIPIALSVAEKASLNHKRLLLPLASAASISGMMTLVATTPNIIINGLLRDQGLATFSFFTFTPFGALVLALAILFMMFFGQNMLAARGSRVVRKKEPTIDDLLQYHKIAKYEYVLRVPPDSDLVGRSVANLQVSAQYHVVLLGVESRDKGHRKEIAAIRPEKMIRSGDILMLIGSPEHTQAFTDEFGLERMKLSAAHRRAFFQVVGIAEVMLNPNSTLIGKSLKEIQFQSAYQSMVLGIRRKGETLAEEVADMPLKFGDVLLVCGAWKDLLRLEQNREQYLLLTLPEDYKEVVPAKRKEKITLFVLAGMVGLMVFGLLPPVAAILAATTLLLLLRCVPRSSIYDVIDWQSIVMVAGMLPLSLALQKTGITSQISAALLEWFAHANPFVILACLYGVTTVMGLFMGGAAVVVLIAPMAIDIGLKLGISPQACAMVVAIACAGSFASPVGSTVNLIVREPGGYATSDYLKIGIPLTIISLLATLGLCWVFFL